MATRLEIAINKLERLERERMMRTEQLFAHGRMANGQPMNDKRNGYAYINRSNQLENKCLNLTEEIEQQRERVEMLKRQEYNKANGLTRSGGLATSVENIDRLKERIEKREKDIENGNASMYSRQYLNKDKKKLQELITLKEQAEQQSNNMSEKTKQLIEEGAVNQWKKKPIYFFVKGLRKVALTINEQGEFETTRQYPPKNQDDIDFIDNLLK